MHYRPKGSYELPASEITPQTVYENRRQLLKSGLSLAAGGALAGLLPSARASVALPGVKSAVPGALAMDKPTSFEDVTHYNNFYEFGTDKADPAQNAGTLKTRPWAVSVEGEVAKPGVFDIDALLKLSPMEDRVYRHRCVEAWSMVIPWVGYSLAELIKRVQPTSRAKYVEFVSLADPKTEPGVSSDVLDWPYVEGLRIDEAMQPLTMLVFGVYGQILPNQNGAPVRVHVPWKYGFKSGKSIVKIRFVERQPTSSWMRAAPSEYGFYANVNPGVDHPRWSQASERPIGEGGAFGGLFTKRKPTLMFNGYGAEVASLYSGMDLRKYF